MRALEGLEPAEVWYWFEEVCSVPRPSGDEERIAGFLVDFARERNLEHMRDTLNNVMVRKKGVGPAAGGAPLLLQAHVDIVPEKKTDSGHDHWKDPIVPVIDGDWVTSPDTTLGADNGIGVALMLAVLDSSDMPHPPLECLFTTDEERGLTGAAGLDPSWITAGRMINLDSEEHGVFVIGCAGGSDCHLFMELKPAGRASCRLLTVSGLRGGHSGMEIHRNRGNAIRFLGRVLSRIADDHGCLVSSVDGGSKRNAIPRDAQAVISLRDEDTEAAQRTVRDVLGELQEEYRGIEEGFEIGLSEVAEEHDVTDSRTTGRIVDLLLALPHGVEKMSGVIEGLVETSVNLALLRTDPSGVSIDLSVRSPLESARRALTGRTGAAARLSGCSFSEGGSYPGWMPDTDSAILSSMAALYSEMFGAEPRIECIHAGLECGIIGAGAGGLDMISVGPDIRDVHVPGEKVSISSLGSFWRFFRSVLGNLDRGPSE